MNRYMLPMGIFIVLLTFLAVGLGLNPREVPSPLIGKPVPAFRLAQLHQPEQTFGPEDLKGKVWLLNVWASWCVSCRQEHPILIDLAKKNIVPIVGLNHKDEGEQAKRWLIQYGGDPYQISAVDKDGKVGIDFGVYGVPETFVVDANGVIQLKFIGPVDRNALETQILPKVRELQARKP